MAADLLPPNATASERALSNSIARIGEIAVPINSLWNPYTCPVRLLPWLAWALSVDVWDTSWSELQKRVTIATAVQVHRIKGTRGAVNRALAALGYEVSLVEWFEDTPKGAPYTFRLEVEVDDRGIDDCLYRTITQVACGAKNTRSHLSAISVAARVSGSVTAQSIPLVGDVLSVSPWAISERTVDSTFSIASGVAVYDTLTVDPQEA